MAVGVRERATVFNFNKAGTMKNPNIQTKVVHSQTKSAWNVIGTSLGGKYKIARVPYVCVGDDEITERNRVEALEHATFISHCFNQTESVSENKPTPVQKFPKWCHVSVLKPSMDYMVLIWAPGYSMEARYGYYRDGIWYDQGLDYIQEEKKEIGHPVTHWMELPQLPIE